MTRFLALLLVLVALTGTATAQLEALDGSWEGALDPDGINLDIRLHFTVGPTGVTGTFDVPPQGAFGVPLEGVAVLGEGEVTFAAPSLPASPSFVGALDGDRITGTFTQGAAQLPFRVERKVVPAAADVAAPPERPQTPVPPFPYAAAEVAWQGDAGTLSGTLLLPEGIGPFPVALLLNGSGAQDRDGTVLGHATMAVLADALARTGIASLRWDDRGVGGSDGDLGSAGYDGLVADVHAALRFLTTRSDVDADRVALLGHSEGGVIAPLAATTPPSLPTPRPVALVLLAAPAIDGVDLLVTQNEAIYRLAGADEEDLAAQVTYLRALHAALAAGDESTAVELTRARATAQLEALPEAQAPLDRDERDAIVTAAAAETLMPTFQDLVLSRPAEALTQLDVPVLALFGELDVQVVADRNAQAMRAALEAAPTATVEVVTLPGLNHLLQPATTGAVEEYVTIPTTVDPTALDAIVAFLEANLVATR